MSPVYPRVGGGTTESTESTESTEGLSPRGRGNRRQCMSPCSLLRSIPAWAGEPCPYRCSHRAFRVYPRVGGGTSPRPRGKPSCEGLSPRGRGNRKGTGLPSNVFGSIPAWAGEPGDTPSDTIISAVYPRVGGGTASNGADQVGVMGLSPRGRGNRVPDGLLFCWGRSIPAWAGEPSRIV